MPIDDSLLETVSFDQRFDGHVGANLCGGLIGDSQQIEEYIFKVDDGDHHS